ncbi:hypothetical protein Prum_037980 [Phytohabitans rumicis]|uniref:SAM-dependent methyltransferase n=2 Tax=Phytohabitans rumicis TaxID=1076125 RepID=A0A6V8L7P5_9ACTN|nr:hypothetical protein Prum_037980 [Phytohabitans rumicis]
MLVVGNPPWVTNAQLTRLDSNNRPERVNIKNLAGMDALTGASNFDIAEFIWLKLISELRSHRPVISLLCKTQVARNVLEHSWRIGLPISSASLRLIDAKKWFAAAVDACLLTIEVGAEGQGGADQVCDLYDTLESVDPARRFGMVDGRLVADLDAYERARYLDGECPVEWRQGMKHDAASVMELPSDRIVDVEDDYVYPLLKGTDVFRSKLDPRRRVIVPQRALGEDTRLLERDAPRLWGYLSKNADVLDGRKSSIYRNRPRFCIFGIGDYSFAPYKIAVSGLHKSASFRAVGPVAGKPVFFDDTCYLLPFHDPAEAGIVAALLATDEAEGFFQSLAFWDAKRPITKKLLKRIDLLALAERVDEQELALGAQKFVAQLGAAVPDDEVLAVVAELKRRWRVNRRP